MFTTFAVLLSACVSGQPASTPPVQVTPGDPPADTAQPDLRRPLCKEEVAGLPTAEDLLAWATTTGAGQNRLLGQGFLRALDGVTGETDDDVVRTSMDRGWRHLAEGRVDEALTDLRAALAIAEDRAPLWRGRTRQVLALAWMRKSEVDNCMVNPDGTACILPFTPSAQHKVTEGMTQAVGLLTAFLTEDEPDHLTARWLLNVAHMALGTWPDGVPEAWLVPEAALHGDTAIAPFTNVATGIGPAPMTMLGGAAVEDFDGDGLLDLLTSTMSLNSGMQLLLNQGDGRFCDASQASGVSSIRSVFNLFPADYDNDGDLDVIGARGALLGPDGMARPSLLNNDGAGHFTDVALPAGLTAPGPSGVTTWADLDHDGLLDLFMARQEGPGYQALPSLLYHNEGDGTFADVSASAGIPASGSPAGVWGASFGDFDNDGWDDLFLSVLEGPNHLLRNVGGMRFEDVTASQHMHGIRASFGAMFLDYNQDGLLDVYQSAYASQYAGDGPTVPVFGHGADDFVASLLGLPANAVSSSLYRNTGAGFEQVEGLTAFEPAHIVMGFNTVDLDTDGWPDLLLGTGTPAFEALTPNLAMRNGGAAGGFSDVTWSSALGQLQKGHGVGAGDLDEDGDEDILAAIGGAYEGDTFPNAVYENPHSVVAAVTLRLEGTTSNRSAIGARVRVVTTARTLHYLVGTGGSFGANSLAVEVGLGESAVIDHVEIDWPGGATETVAGVEPGYVVDLRQGEGVVARAPYRRIALAQPMGHVGP